MVETRKKTYIFSTIIVAGLNSIYMNKFKYDEAKIENHKSSIL